MSGLRYRNAVDAAAAVAVDAVTADVAAVGVSPWPLPKHSSLTRSRLSAC